MKKSVDNDASKLKSWQFLRYCKDFSRRPWPPTGREVLFSRYSIAFSIPRMAGAVYKFQTEQGEWAKWRPPLLSLPRARVLEISPIALKNSAKEASLKIYTTLYDTLILPWTSLKLPVCASVAVPFKMTQSLREIKKQSNLCTQYWLPLSVMHK